ncbi:hypothetical protein L842_0151 [Mycobacterium intracellulare MIN_052511_1280]|nr:hypothetical protein L842_0151 [Mycobacterium intracellulare MIN_052511_1280]
MLRVFLMLSMRRHEVGRGRISTKIDGTADDSAVPSGGGFG